MIYNRWGDQCEIVARFSEMRIKEFNAPITLVKVRYGPGAIDRFQFAHTLRADDGILKIVKELEKLPVSTISATALRNAIREAM